jgi:hypothetical protein
MNDRKVVGLERSGFQETGKFGRSVKLGDRFQLFER